MTPEEIKRRLKDIIWTLRDIKSDLGCEEGLSRYQYHREPDFTYVYDQIQRAIDALNYEQDLLEHPEKQLEPIKCECDWIKLPVSRQVR